MHLAQVVAVAVLPHHGVVLALTRAQPDRAFLARAHAGAAGQTQQLVHARHHDQAGAAGQLTVELGHAERVGDTAQQRADVLDAAQHRPQLVAQRHLVVPRQALQHEARPRAQRVRDAVLQQQAARR